MQCCATIGLAGQNSGVCATQCLTDRALGLFLLLAGYSSIQEVKQHAFFAGINWEAVRKAPAPQTVACRQHSPQDVGLDWELTSLIRTSQPVRYEYLTTEATV